MSNARYQPPETFVPKGEGPSANTPFRPAAQRKEPGRVGRLFRKIGRLWMERSRPKGPAVRLPDDPGK